MIFRQAGRRFTSYEYSHVGIAWVVSGRVFVLEAVTPMVRCVPLSNMLPCYHVSTNARWREEVEQVALSMVGNPTIRYSQREALAAFLGKNKRDDDKIECAEYVQIVLSCAGLLLKGKATPTDVVQDCLLAGGQLTYLEV